MTAFLDGAYFEWLYAQVARSRSRSPSRNFWNLFHILYTTEFLWFVPNDDNRLQDGRDLRYLFVDSEQIELSDRDQHWVEQNVSVLEVLIGLAKRLAFETDTEIDIWFWELMENLDLDKYNDRAHIPKERVKKILDRVIWRTYEYDGTGGLFPLVNPDKDQTKVELWIQLNAYLIERGY